MFKIQKKKDRYKNLVSFGTEKQFINYHLNIRCVTID